ncbi:uncharacterized protein EI90DRAFT_3123078 [Cantharellus anzutake]|uniref:uncharacterized protein n=1 Tax=Cantharellus anzutake TaxID=1750568 RepID=UPI001908AF55|nr:uncharacterized protein EI90DRAFT_3123078 [Cantharellus anzutake]KAF8331991.1 hypothetical protein EI90DRAFT_3123078 [Cantharellus anzutake]
MARYRLTALSYIAAVLVIIPSPSQWRAGNISVLSIIAWLFILNVYRGTNTIIWANNVRVVAPVYCDIGNLLWVAAMWGLPASAVCLTRYLASITSPTHAISGLREKRKRFWFEMTMCVFLPFVYAGLHYVVQGDRFDILEDFGCQPDTYFNWVAICLVYASSVALSFISSVYVGIAMYRLARYSVTCRRLLTDSPSGLTRGQYIRLMALGLAEVATDLGMNLYVLITDLKLGGIEHSVSWARVHYHYGVIGKATNASMTPQIKTFNTVIFTIPINSGFAFFCIFGFGREAIADYKKFWAWIKTHIFRMGRPATVMGHEHTIVRIPAKKSSGVDDRKHEMPAHTALDGSTQSKSGSRRGMNCHDDDDSDFVSLADIENPKPTELIHPPLAVPPPTFLIPATSHPRQRASINADDIHISLPTLASGINPGASPKL